MTFLLTQVQKSLLFKTQASLKKLSRVGLGALGLWLAIAVPGLAVDVRVAIRRDVEALTIGSSESAQIKNGRGQVIGNLTAKKAVRARAVAGAVALNNKQAWQLEIVPETDDGLVFIGDRWYRGKVRLARTSTGLTAINHVDLEMYLASVIGKEMYVSWPQAALQAQAVASRSYALYKIQRQQNKLFDLLSTTTSQVYGGVEGEAPSTLEAVAATEGQVLTHSGKIIEAVFHSSSGGHTENSEHVWMSAVPYLRGVPDYDHEAPVYQWQINFTASQLRQRLPGVGNIRALIPVQTSPTGRVKKLRVQGDAGSQTISGRQLRKSLGLKSTLFQVQPNFAPVAGQPVALNGFSILGRGYGHGIGMSQWGAHGMANQGKNYQEIVQHYYPGTILKRVL
ncbi:MAG: SpoIID/LytB domain-containing protein [Cyanobacteria bacterium P01_F01_bin.42]